MDIQLTVVTVDSRSLSKNIFRQIPRSAIRSNDDLGFTDKGDFYVRKNRELWKIIGRVYYPELGKDEMYLSYWFLLLQHDETKNLGVGFHWSEDKINYAPFLNCTSQIFLKA